MLRDDPASTPTVAPANLQSRALVDVEWAKAAQAALGSALFAGLLGGAVYVLGRVMVASPLHSDESTAYAPFVEEEDASDAEDIDEDEDENENDDVVDDDAGAPSTAEPPTVSNEEQLAATLLGIDTAATEDQIRAALRSRLATSRLHPDHGGDGAEATRLIAAKNLLTERARDRASRT